MAVFPIRVCAIPMPAPTNGANGPAFGAPSAARSAKTASIPDTDDSFADTDSRCPWPGREGYKNTMNYRLMRINSSSIWSEVVTIRAAAENDRWAKIILANSFARSTVDASKEAGA